MTDKSSENTGRIVSVRGSVVDARFPVRIPLIHNVLRAGPDEQIVIEVLTHLDSQTVRGIALTSTQGLQVGGEVTDTRRGLQVPVGRNALGRVFNVFGDTIDRRDPIENAELRSIHQPSISLEQQSTVTEVFQTGIKAIDVLSPLEQGGKAGLFGGAGDRKSVV